MYNSARMATYARIERGLNKALGLKTKVLHGDGRITTKDGPSVDELMDEYADEIEKANYKGGRYND